MDMTEKLNSHLIYKTTYMVYLTIIFYLNCAKIYVGLHFNKVTQIK